MYLELSVRTNPFNDYPLALRNAWGKQGLGLNLNLITILYSPRLQHPAINGRKPNKLLYWDILNPWSICRNSEALYVFLCCVFSEDLGASRARYLKGVCFPCVILALQLRSFAAAQVLNCMDIVKSICTLKGIRVKAPVCTVRIFWWRTNKHVLRKWQTWRRRKTM